MKTQMNAGYFRVIVISILLVNTATYTCSYKATIYNSKTVALDLSWTVDYVERKVDFVLEVSCHAEYDCSSTVGIGMSDRGKVVNADVMMIRHDEDKVEIQDSWTDSSGLIHGDDQQDYHLDEYLVDPNLVTVGFWRLFNTGDKHDYKLDNGTTHLIYLLHKHDGGSGEALTLHNFKDMQEFISFASSEMNAREMEHGFYRVQLLKPDIPPSYFGNALLDDSSSFSILQPNIALPKEVTTYWCSVHELPKDIKDKVHGIGYDANISAQSLGVVHHMEVFMCDKNDGHVTPYSGFCDANDVPDDVKRCDRVMAAWAKGADPFFYPEKAGIPFGDSSQSRYFRLEVHYHNPKLTSGIVDSSGVTFQYTKSLRKYDAGILEVGVTYTGNVGIPPRQSNFVLPGYCPKECTEALPPGGIHIFGSQLHTHLAGRKIWTSHIRNDDELAEINRDNHYSTWFEEIRHIYPEVNILPGDSVVTYCSYDTSKRKAPTLGGMGIFEEMCVNYMHYYPLARLEVCKSSPSLTSLAEFFLLEKLFTGQPEKLDFERMSSNYFSMSWNANASSALEQVYMEADVAVECKNHYGRQFHGKWSDVTIY